MNRIDTKFRKLKKEGKKAFIVYITCGDPSLAVSKRIILSLEKCGVDIIELGVPFSDPLADGPVIQAASQRALKNKVNLQKIFQMAAELRRKTEIPLVLMTYFNPVFQYGLGNFCQSCKRNGIDAVIIPDLPYEEADGLLRCAKKQKVAVIFLVAPTSTKERIKKIIQKSQGFVYYVSLTGVTGARKSLPANLIAHLKLIKRMSNKPICVGFGISTPQQAEMIAGISDGIIVGSAVIQKIAQNLGRRDLLEKVSSFVRTLRQAI